LAFPPKWRCRAGKRSAACCHIRCGNSPSDAAPAARIEHPLLTRRELEIVTLILKGHSNLSLAAVLSLSPNTVKVHRRQIYSKLAISSQAELFRLFLA